MSNDSASFSSLINHIDYQVHRPALSTAPPWSSIFVARALFQPTTWIVKMCRSYRQSRSFRLQLSYRLNLLCKECQIVRPQPAEAYGV